MNRAPLLLTILLLCSGCGTLNVQLLGTIHETPPQAALNFDEAGFPYIGEQQVQLPRAQEDLRYGLVVIDSTPLPPAWRAAHAPEGGVLVAAVDKASPLALAGLRSYDLIVEVNGQPAQPIEMLISVLQEAEHVELTTVPWGTNHEGEAKTRPNTERSTQIVAAQTRGLVQSASSFGFPWVLQTRNSNTGGSFALGPLSSVFSARQTVLEEERGANPALVEGRHRVKLVDRSEWSFLFGLFRYQGETDLDSGVTRRRLRLLWFLNLGDDLPHGLLRDLEGSAESLLEQ